MVPFPSYKPRYRLRNRRDARVFFPFRVLQEGSRAWVWLLGVVMGLVGLAGCRHKELLDMPGEERGRIFLRFDWSGCRLNDGSEPVPSAMIVYFYPVDSQRMSTGEALVHRFELAGSKGGEVSLPAGRYNVMAFNADPAHVYMTGEDSQLSIRCMTGRITVQARRSDSQPLHYSPGYVWRGWEEEVVVDDPCHRGKDQHIAIRMEELFRRYRFEVHDVENISSVRAISTEIDGMAPGEWMLDGAPCGEAAGLAVEKTYIEGNMIHGNLHTFGPAWETVEAKVAEGSDWSSEELRNKLVLKILLVDNQRVEYIFDVTDQIVNAPDRKNVLIKIQGLSLPVAEPQEPIQGGIQVGVDDWNTIVIDFTQ